MLCVRGVFVRFGIVVCTAAGLEFVGGAQYVIWVLAPTVDPACAALTNQFMEWCRRVDGGSDPYSLGFSNRDSLNATQIRASSI